MTGRRSNAKAFTLLELLVATTMVLVLSVSLYASLRIVFQARTTANRAIESVRRADMVLGILLADLQSALITNQTLAPDFQGSSGKGPQGLSEDLLAFYATSPDADPDSGRGDIKKIEYSLETAAGGSSPMLVRHVTTNLLSPVVSPPRDEILCRGIKALTLRFFDGEAWQEEWDSTAVNNVLPRAVEVTIQFEADATEPQGAAPAYVRVISLPCGQDAAVTAGGTSS